MSPEQIREKQDKVACNHFRKPLWREPDSGNSVMRSCRRFLTGDSVDLNNSIGLCLTVYPKFLWLIKNMFPRTPAGLEPMLQSTMQSVHDFPPIICVPKHPHTEEVCVSLSATSSDATNLLLNVVLCLLNKIHPSILYTRLFLFWTKFWTCHSQDKVKCAA